MQPYLWLLGEQPQGEFLAAVSGVTGLSCRESSADGSIDVFAKNVSSFIPHRNYNRLSPRQTDDAQRHITCLQLARRLGVHKAMDAAAKCRLAKECLKRLKKAVDDKVDDLSIFEQYALIAAQLLWDIYTEQGKIDECVLFTIFQ